MQALHLGFNNLEYFGPEALLSPLVHLDLRGNEKLDMPPKSERKNRNCLSRVKAYFKAISEGKVRWHTARVLFLGHQKSGKTSLMQSLTTMEPTSGRRQVDGEAVGIDMLNWDLTPSWKPNLNEEPMIKIPVRVEVTVRSKREKSRTRRQDGALFYCRTAFITIRGHHLFVAIGEKQPIQYKIIHVHSKRAKQIENSDVILCDVHQSMPQSPNATTLAMSIDFSGGSYRSCLPKSDEFELDEWRRVLQFICRENEGLDTNRKRTREYTIRRNAYNSLPRIDESSEALLRRQFRYNCWHYSGTWVKTRNLELENARISFAYGSDKSMSFTIFDDIQNYEHPIIFQGSGYQALSVKVSYLLAQSLQHQKFLAH